MGLFNFDNPVMSILRKIIDMIWLNILWLVFSIPIITIGASSTAFYYTINKSINHKRGYVTAQFMSAFKTNFKQSSIVWLILGGIAALFLFDIDIMKLLSRKEEGFSHFAVLFQILIALEGIYSVYVFAYIGRFSNKLKSVFLNSALLAIRHLLSTILISVIIGIAIFVIWLIPITLILVPATAASAINIVLEKIFRIYMAQEDKEREDILNY
jgi:uncharacterized membrane protein YesL